MQEKDFESKPTANTVSGNGADVLIDVHAQPQSIDHLGREDGEHAETHRGPPSIQAVQYRPS